MKQRRPILTALLTILLLAGAVMPVYGEEEKPAGEVALSALTKYVWRGQELTRHSIVLEPSITVGYKGLTANIWGNVDTSPYAAEDESYSSTWTETDLTVGYSRAFGPLTAGIGYIYYGLSPAHASGMDPLDSQEIFVTVGLNTILAPTLTVYREIDHYHQWFLILGVSHTIPLGTRAGLKLAASASYLKSTDADTYPEFDGDALPTKEKYDNFHDGVLSAALPVKLLPYLTVTPSVTYVFPLCGDAKDEMKGRGIAATSHPADRDSDFLYGGLTVAFSF
jgi:hypothetical protein